MGKKSRRNKPKRSAAPATPAPTPSTSPHGEPLRARGGCGGGGCPVASRVPVLPTPFTPTTQSELDAIATPRVVSSDARDPARAPPGSTCWVCLEGPGGDDDNDEPLRRDCACRGEGGYAHLSCLVAMATMDSEAIWSQKKTVRDDVNSLAFGEPWTTCTNCKQLYAGQLSEDMAHEFVRSTEGMMDGPRSVRHAVAKILLNRSMMANHTSSEDYSKVQAHCDGVIGVIRSCYKNYVPLTVGDARWLSFMQFYLRHIEMDTLSFGLQWTIEMLEHVAKEEGTTAQCKNIYARARHMSEETAQIYESLKNSDLYAIHRQNKCAIDTGGSHLVIWRARLKNFAYLDASNDHDKAKDGDDQEERNVTELSEKLMRAAIQMNGEGSVVHISSALEHAQTMIWAGAEAKPYAIVEFLIKTLHASTQTLGKDHECSKQARELLGSFVARDREGRLADGPDQAYFPIVRYEADSNRYLVYNGTVYGVPTADVILARRAMVRCVDLTDAAQLNGERGWVHGFDEATGHHRVRFEDESIQPRLVRGSNLRLVFFREEYELSLSEKMEYYNAKMAPGSVEGK